LNTLKRNLAVRLDANASREFENRTSASVNRISRLAAKGILADSLPKNCPSNATFYKIFAKSCSRSAAVHILDCE